MVEVDHTVTSANESYHATAFTGGAFTTATDTLTKSSHGLAVGDVIDVTAATGSSTITVGRYRVLTVTSSSAVVLQTVDSVALTYSADASANVTFIEFSTRRFLF